MKEIQRTGDDAYGDEVLTKKLFADLVTFQWIFGAPSLIQTWLHSFKDLTIEWIAQSTRILIANRQARSRLIWTEIQGLSANRNWCPRRLSNRSWRASSQR